MNPEEHAQIKAMGSPESIAWLIRELGKYFEVTTTSPIIQHRGEAKAHQYAMISPREAQR